MGDYSVWLEGNGFCFSGIQILETQVFQIHDSFSSFLKKKKKKEAKLM